MVQQHQDTGDDVVKLTRRRTSLGLDKVQFTARPPSLGRSASDDGRLRARGGVLLVWLLVLELLLLLLLLVWLLLYLLLLLLLLLMLVLVLMLMLLLLLLIPQRRTRLALGVQSDTALAGLVADTLAAQLLGVTAIAGFPNDIIGHGHGHSFGGEGGRRRDMELV